MHIGHIEYTAHVPSALPSIQLFMPQNASAMMLILDDICLRVRILYLSCGETDGNLIVVNFLLANPEQLSTLWYCS